MVLTGGVELEQLRKRLPGELLDLTEIDLSTTDLSQRRLSMINFDGADLSRAFVASSELVDSRFRHANLQRAQLIGATVTRCDFEGADLMGSNWRSGNIVNSRPDRARFAADIVGAVLRNVSVEGADFSGAEAGHTLWSDLNLAPAVGLDKLRHSSASTIGLDTIVRSHGRI
jgi:uncharacterized protein YjbI with pentapeptide repeats